VAARRSGQLLRRCPPLLRCQRTARRRQRTATTANAALPALPAMVPPPKTPRYRWAATMLPSCRHRHAATATTAHHPRTADAAAALPAVAAPLLLPLLVAARRSGQLLRRCPPPSRCRRTARRRQRTATAANAVLPALPAAVPLPKTLRYRQAAAMLPSWPPPPRCHRCHRRRRAAATAATALPPLLPRCRCPSRAATAATALPSCCPPQLCCSRRRHGRGRAAAATLALSMPPPRCLPSPRRCCGRRITVALPSRRPLPVPSCCRRAVHSHRRWLIVVFYPSARCSHNEKGWLWSWSDPATLLPAAAVLKPAPPRPPPRCRHHPCTADAAATLPSVAALLLQPSHYRRVAVAPSIACAVALLSRCPSPPLLIDCCIFPHGACCSRDGKGWLRSREAKIPQRKLEFWSPEENGA
jgi:hypothetical protein